jgi:hypothetical protein
MFTTKGASMHLVKLSSTRGLNAAHLREWQDLPDGDPPSLALTMGVHAAQERASTITLVGDERLLMLRWLDRESDIVAPPLSEEPAGGHASQQDWDNLLKT